jgi:hypothetical protein
MTEYKGTGSKTSDIRLTHSLTFYKESGSCFDATTTDKIVVRPGGHDHLRQPPLDISAFSLAKRTARPSPGEFLKRASGMGGTLVNPEVAAASSGKLSPLGSSIKPRAGAFMERANPPNTEFRRFYERGDLPIQRDHSGVRNRLAWKVEIPKLDFHHYLPIFFDGLREVEQPFAFLAEQGIVDMLRAGWNKVLPVIPQLIIPIKTALNTRNHQVVCKTIKVLQLLTLCDVNKEGSPPLIGQALVPYYRQILPMFNLFVRKNNSLGDGIEFGQRTRTNMGDLISETLELFEMYGGEDAFINIKYLVPTYQSAILG